MSVAPPPKESLSYGLLLQKACSAGSVDVRFVDDASTAAPDHSSCSSVAESSQCTVPAKSTVVLLHSVAIHARTDERLTALIRMARELSQKVFDEDCLLEVTKKSGWKLTLLASDDLSVLCGFLVAKVTGDGCLSIAKIAVPVDFRGFGFGKLIMDDAIKNAKKQGSHLVCLSALPTAVTFYQRIGFKAFKSVKAKTDEDLIEGQVYMEKKLRAGRK
mmetsp:Transcript_78909/g.223314  ORF Transcript_78909/g.223314 Transcript_78909/m.223314 type:complete len:217 (-) Transcript_78909:169-819(-)|eukprot:CAMPEP_0179244650 /NCGR_PEP_ID=MMETSP0797-20121207/18167_1 /TAXON_ID=47934 /ORGANISM="Dinophysis acuminata, Strain DAEP01" /LENGTH=216 /DNA_ID=CAMNT_0020952173 /DNA_START=70 /DNA_END=720 /DNA_ORIENTATION=-